MPDEWKLDKQWAEQSRLSDFNQKHPAEYAACFVNLDRTLSMLVQHKGPTGFHVGFFRSEGQGVFRIGQTGVAHAVETRLYVYLLLDHKTIYVLTIGDKTQQKDDIKRCKRLAKRIASGESNGNDERSGDGGGGAGGGLRRGGEDGGT
jgi:hypothetical protein